MKSYEEIKTVKFESVSSGIHNLFMKTVSLKKRNDTETGKVSYGVFIRMYQNEISDHPLAAMSVTVRDTRIFKDLKYAEAQFNSTLEYLKKKNKTDGTFTFVETDKNLHSKCKMSLSEYFASFPKR